MLYVLCQTIEKLPKKIGVAKKGFCIQVSGGLVLGIINGALSSLLCKKVRNQKQLQPAVLVVFCYLAYTNARFLRVSDVLAVVTCGILQRRYGFQNLGKKPERSLNDVLNALANLLETLVFLFFGVDLQHHLFDGKEDWM